MERILDRYERYLLCEGGDVMEDHPEEMQVYMNEFKLESGIRFVKTLCPCLFLLMTLHLQFPGQHEL